MPGPLLDIPFPKLGLDEGSAYTEQPPLTTPFVKNWVLRDPLNGRLRGAKRSGTTRYVVDRVNGSNAVAAIAVLNRQNTMVSYSPVNGGNGPTTSNIAWASPVPDNQLRDVRSLAVDRFGNIYASCGRRGVLAKFGHDGVLVWTHTVELDDPNQDVRSIRVDFDGDVYVGVGGEPPTSTGRVIRFEQVRDGLKMVWREDALNGGTIEDVAVEGQWMYVLENTGNGYHLSRYGAVKTRRPELLWSVPEIDGAFDKPGVAVRILPSGMAVVASLYGPDGLGPDPYTGRLRAYQAHDGTRVAEYGGPGESGVGLGLAVDDEGAIYGHGFIRDPNGQPAEKDSAVKLKLTYDAGTDTWSFVREWGYAGSTDDFPSKFVGPDEMAVDRDGRSYIVLLGSVNGTLVRLKSDGTLDWQVSILPNSQAVVLDDFYPVAHDDPDYGSLGHESVIVGTALSGGGNSLYRVNVLDATVSDAAPRSVEVLAVSGGTIRRASSGSWVTPTGGSNALSTNRRFVRAVAARDRVYFLDGERYRVYDPRLDLVSEWRAERGRIPPRCKLSCVWGGRFVLARDDSPYNWYMSRVGDFDDWDFFPFPPSVDQAVAGNVAPAGLSPDIVNTIVPYTDDLLLFGGDRSIWRLTGDPADGGRFDLVSDVTGMAYGLPWCKDPEGVLYFVGSRGGVFAYAPGNSPIEISNPAIRNRLASIDFQDAKFSLVWNDRERAVMLFVSKYDGSASEHYLWDRDAKSWWPFTFANTGHEPLSVSVLDGDEPDDRAVLLGSHDGYVRFWDANSDSDDDGYGNTPIDADLFIGPFVPDPQMEARVTKLYAVLGFDSAATAWELYGSDSPDFADRGTPKASGTLSYNRTTTANVRARGHALWVRLRNNAPGQRCQFESLRAEVHLGSRVRVR